jgi:hypothetical protein
MYVEHRYAASVLALLASASVSCDERQLRMEYQENAAATAPAGTPAAAPVAPPAAAATRPAASGKYDSALGLPRAGNRDYVASLYRCVLHREGDAAGVAAFAGRLDAGKNRELVVVNFFELPDYLACGATDREFVRDGFQAVLGREPSAAETEKYLGELAKAPHRRTVILLLFATSEYQKIKADLRK